MWKQNKKKKVKKIIFVEKVFDSQRIIIVEKKKKKMDGITFDKLRERYTNKFVNEFSYADAHIESANIFYTESIPAIIRDCKEIDVVRKGAGEVHVYGLHMAAVGRPTFKHPETGEQQLLFPSVARTRNMAYTAPIYVKISHTVHVYDPYLRNCRNSFGNEDGLDNNSITMSSLKAAAEAFAAGSMSTIEYEEEMRCIGIITKFPEEIQDSIQLYRRRYGRLLSGELYENQLLCELPVMLRSAPCNLNSALAGCCPGANDLAGLFVINGTNRVISPPSRWCWNHDFVFRRSKKNFAAEAEVRSCHDTRLHRSTATLKLFISPPNLKSPMNGRQIMVSIPFLAKKIHIAIIFLALGWEATGVSAAIRSASGNHWYPDFDNMVQALLFSCKIRSEDEALLAVAQASKKTKPMINNNNNYNTYNVNSGQQQSQQQQQQQQQANIQFTLNETDAIAEQIRYARDTLNRELLPHVGLSSEANLAKGLYLGSLVWKLFMCATCRMQPDDRDDYGFKRFDSAGVLMANLLRQVLGVYMRQRKQAISKSFDKEDRAAQAAQLAQRHQSGRTIHNVIGPNDEEQSSSNISNNSSSPTTSRKNICVSSIFTDPQITTRFSACFGTGKLTASKGSYVRTGVARQPSHVNRVAAVCEISRLSSTLKPDGKHVTARMISPSSYGLVCSSETPEGRPCGLVMYTAIGAKLSAGGSPRLLIALVEERAEQFGFVPIKRWGEILRDNGSPHFFDDYAKLRIEGIPLGWLADPDAFVTWLRRMRTSSSFDGDISVYHDPNTNEVLVRMDAGRLVRPLFLRDRIDYLQNLFLHDWSTLSINQLVNDGCIEYIDALETRAFAIAFDHADMIKREIEAKAREREKEKEKKKENHTNNSNSNNNNNNGLPRPVAHLPKPFRISHIELDGSLQFGLSTSLIPFPHFNQSPRNIYQCAMGKQAISVDPESSSLHRSRHELYYPQRPFISTKTGKSDNYGYQSSGVNAVLAMLSEALNQEDALMIRKTFVERGGLMSASCRLYKEHQRKFGSSSNRENFEIPDRRTCGGVKDSCYNKCQKNGIPLLGTQVLSNDVVIAKTTPVRQLTSQKELKQNREALEALHKLHGIKGLAAVPHIARRDASLVHTGEPGVITQSIETTNAAGLAIRKVEVTAPRLPEIGDKFSSRHGQKGTCSRLVPDEDMISTANGFMPDIVVNPNCLVSRMTVAQQVESLLGKASAISGEDFSDATAFTQPDIEKAEQLLKEAGFSPSGMEIFYHPITGKKIKARIYVGCVWMQRLKHMTADKMHARGPSGPNESTVRQPLEGRGRGGGQRFGGMELDCLTSHACPHALGERILKFSDPWDAYICSECGFAACINARTKKPWCTHCGTGRNVFVVTTSYAFMLLVKELAAMGIRLKFKLSPLGDFFSPQMLIQPNNLVPQNIKPQIENVINASRLSISKTAN